MEYIGLDAIGKKHGTDKSSSGHNYLHFYEELLTPWRDRVVNIVEFGCYQGASLNTFAEFFPKARIVGLDKDVSRVAAKYRNIRVEHCDVMDQKGVRSILKTFEPTVLIDDASHIWSEQITAFESYFSFVLPGGYYICEDIQTSFGEAYGSCCGDRGLDAAGYFAILALIVGGAVDGEAQPHKLFPYGQEQVRLAPAIEQIIFRNHCVIVKKKAAAA